MEKGRVLITGVAGFIGSNLADRLCTEGYEIIGIDNLSYGVKEQIPAGVKFHKLDIRSKEIQSIFEGVDYVFHMAAKNCIEDCQQDPVETADINVTGLVNVFEAAKQAKVKKVIYAESSAVYEGIKKFPTPEIEVSPVSFYAISKFAGNAFADAYRRFYGITSVGLRYFSVYGPRQDYRRTIPPSMSTFIIKFLKGERPVIYGDGSKRRDFVHVDDINDFHLLCLRDARVDNKIFNLGSGTNTSILELYTMIKKLMLKDGEPIFKKNLAGEAQDTLADISAARAIGWTPRVALETGLRGMIEFVMGEFQKGNVK